MQGLDAGGNARMGAERLFRLYRSHCLAPGQDTLFSLLEAAHALNDRLREAVAIDFRDLDEFVALRCLRNFFHHQQELRHEVRIVPTGSFPISTDLTVLCLVPRCLVEDAIASTKARPEAVARACSATFHWYGTIVNINPSLFNFVAKAYERLCEAGIHSDDVAMSHYGELYKEENERGMPHLIDGRITTVAGGVNEFLAKIMESA